MKERCLIPCNSITTQSVNLKNAISDLVVEAMTISGWRVDMATNTQVQATLGGSQLLWVKGKGLAVRSYAGASQNQKVMTDITKAYSAAAVTWAAKRAGWAVQRTNDKITLARR